MALRLREVYPEREFTYLCTPTGDELPELLAHWQRLELLLGQPIVHLTNGTLRSWIDRWQALPNWRQRWCTRELKIVPCLAYFKRLPPGSVLYVGLRADEEEREGIYSRSLQSVFPLREWGWDLHHVTAYLRDRGIAVPKRTDCARCYGQRLSEWYALWRDYPAIYADAEADEARTGATFRSPGRDSWPAPLHALRAEFERGRVPRGVLRTLELFDDDLEQQPCRVCRI